MIAAAASTVTLDANTIIIGLIGLVPAILTAFIALRQKEQKDSLREIHTAVNSGRTTLENKIDSLIEKNEELTKKVATLEENKRGAELAKAVSEVKPVMVATTVTPASSGAATPLKEAIADLTEAAKDTSVAADKTVEMVVKVPHA